MGESFAARIQERARLLEAARNGELTPASARAARTSSLDSMPGGSLPREDVTSVEDLLRRPTPRQLLIGGAVLLVFLLAGVFFALSSGEEEEEIELPIPVVVQPPPPPEPPVLTIETDPPGAMIMVDGKEAGRSPLTFEAIELGEHTVAATLQGRKPAERQVKLENPGERAMVLLALAPEPPPPPPRDPPRSSRRTPQPGKLTLDTTPWTRVFLRGKKLGDTPLIGVTLPAGKHQLKLLNEEKNISTIIEVDIRSGKTTAKKLRL
jgi:serine/threonine-protein kinase